MPGIQTALLEEIVGMCVSLGGTSFVFLVITILCIATCSVLQKVHSLTRLKIFAVCDACCILYSETGLFHFFLAGKFVGKIWKVQKELCK